MNDLSRREFLAAGAAVAVTSTAIAADKETLPQDRKSVV